MEEQSYLRHFKFAPYFKIIEEVINERREFTAVIPKGTNCGTRMVMIESRRRLEKKTHREEQEISNKINNKFSLPKIANLLTNVIMCQ